MADVFRMVARTLTSTSNIVLADLHTASTAIVRGVTICNTSTVATAVFELSVIPNGLTASVTMFKGVSLAAQATSQPLNNTLVLNGGDKLQAKASVANQLDATVSYLESY
jgi:hypothetical protein